MMIIKSRNEDYGSLSKKNDCGRTAGAEPESSAGPTGRPLHKEGD